MQKNIMKLLSITAIATLSLSAWGDTIYKCKDQQGDFLYQKSPCKADVEAVASWAVAAKESAPVPAPVPDKKNKIEFIVKQNSNGAYFLTGAINDKALTFVIDTGASFVSLPSSVAHDAGIYCQNNIDMQTATGAVEKSCSANIKKLNLGPFVIKDVMAVMMPNLSQPLLGMNILQQFKMTQENGEMRLSTLE